MKRRLASVILVLLLSCQSVLAQASDSVREYRRANEQRILREFVQQSVVSSQ